MQVKLPDIKYQIIDIRNIRENYIDDAKTRKKYDLIIAYEDDPQNYCQLTGADRQIETTALETTQRFWDSLTSKYGFSPSIFNLLDMHEVFCKIAEKQNPQIRIATENNKLLAVSNPEKSIITINALTQVLNKVKTYDIGYQNGIITSRHMPRVNLDFKLENIEFSSRMVMETPIDGYGKPSIWLAMKCNDTIITASDKTFQSTINIGTDNHVEETMLRTIQSFSNEDGFIALKQRLIAASNSWASIREVGTLQELFSTLTLDEILDSYVRKIYGGTILSIDLIKEDLHKAIQSLSGDVREIYGIAQVSVLSNKKKSIMPTKLTVLDLIMFASGIGNRAFTISAEKKIQQFVGDLVSEEFDLENSKVEFPKFGDFMSDSKNSYDPKDEYNPDTDQFPQGENWKPNGWKPDPLE